MKKSLFCVSLVAFVLLVVETTHHFPAASGSSSSNDLVSETCEKTPYYELCVSTLRSDPKSKSADVAGLGVIVVNAVKSNAESTTQRIIAIKDPELKFPLNECYDCYYAVLNADVPSAIQGFTRGDPKFAESDMDDAAKEADYCEQAFGGGKSPLTSMNELVAQLSLVASAIATTLL